MSDNRTGKSATTVSVPSKKTEAVPVTEDAIIHSIKPDEDVELAKMPSRGHLRDQLTNVIGDADVLHYLRTHPLFYSQFAWDGTDPSGTTLFEKPVTPALGHVIMTHFSHMFNAWRGQMEWVVYVAGTGFHAGKLIAGWLPPNIVIEGRSLAELTAFPHVFLDVKCQTSIAFTGPDMLDTNFHYMDTDDPIRSTGGTFYVKVFLPLQLADAAANPTVNIGITTKLHKDFEFKMLIPPALTGAPQSPWQLLNFRTAPVFTQGEDSMVALSTTQDAATFPKATVRSWGGSTDVQGVQHTVNIKNAGRAAFARAVYYPEGVNNGGRDVLDTEKAEEAGLAYRRGGTLMLKDGDEPWEQYAYEDMKITVAPFKGKNDDAIMVEVNDMETNAAQEGAAAVIEEHYSEAQGMDADIWEDMAMVGTDRGADNLSMEDQTITVETGPTERVVTFHAANEAGYIDFGSIIGTVGSVWQLYNMVKPILPKNPIFDIVDKVGGAILGKATVRDDGIMRANVLGTMKTNDVDLKYVGDLGAAETLPAATREEIVNLQYYMMRNKLRMAPRGAAAKTWKKRPGVLIGPFAPEEFKKLQEAGEIKRMLSEKIQERNRKLNIFEYYD